MEIQISTPFTLKFTPTTAMAELGETVSQYFDGAVGEIKTYSQTYKATSQKKKP